MSEREAWLWLAALIEACPEYLAEEVSGLCACVFVLHKSRAISLRDRNRMFDRVYEAVGPRRVYLARPNRWDKTRLNWCLKFAEEA